MKIKHLAIAILSVTLVASPLLAKDKKKIEPVTMQKRIDQSSPVNLNTDTVENELRNGSNKRSNPMFVDTQSKGEMIDDKTSESTNEREKGSNMASGKRTHKPVNDTEQLENASTKAHKLGARISTEGQAHRAVSGTNEAGDMADNSKRAALKIEGIVGESKDEDHSMKFDGVDGESKDVDHSISPEHSTADDTCGDLKENERCVDGHVTVLK